MSARVFIGIDLGTTVLKAAAFDGSTGRALARASRRMPVLLPRPGLREQSPEDVSAALDSALRRIRRGLDEAAKGAWGDVAGIGLASQGGSCAVADRTTGRCETRFVLWNDARGAEYLEAIRAQRAARFWRARSYRDGPPAGLGRLKCICEDAPRALRPENVCVGAGDYAFHRLTGAWRQDAGHAIQMGWYHWVDERLDFAALRAAGIGPVQAPPLREGHEPAPLSPDAARRWGLPPGIPVVGPYLDHEAAFMSVADAHAKTMFCSLGTAWVATWLRPRSAGRDRGLQLVLPDPLLRGRRLIVMPIGLGNVSWEWALRLFAGGRSLSERLARARAVFAERLLPPHGLVALAHLTRPNPFAPARQGAGAFAGVGPHVERGDLLRALAAGMVFEMVCAVRPPCPSAAAAGAKAALRQADRAVLGGGASQGEHFRRLFAALLHPAPVFVQEDPDLAGARGALFALSRRVARGRVRRVAAPGMQLRREACEAFALYNRVRQAMQIVE